MKPIHFLPCLFAFALGCSGGGDEGATNLPKGAGTISNPSGQPQNPEQARLAEQMRLAGESAGRRMEEAARLQKEAMQRTGGK